MNPKFLTVAAAVLLSAQVARADAIDDYVRARQTKDHVPGIAIAVLKDGKVVRKKGYGLADVEHSSLVTTSTPYQLASVTKQFTATGIMMLIEEDKIKLEGKITDYLPNLPNTWRDITVRQLLNHTSGIKSYTNVDSFRKTFRKDFSHTEIIDLVKGEPLEFAPGAGWNYNNTGFYLLGMLIEKVIGKTYGAFLSERIFTPLGMTRTRVNDLSVVLPGRVRGYSWNNNSLVNGEYISPTQPFAAGALVSTIDDMIRWEGALASGKLLKKSSWEQMWAKTRLSDGKLQGYGFGWEVGEINGHRKIAHGGGIPGFSTNISRFTDDKVTVIVLCNSDQVNADSIAGGIARRYIPTLAPTPPKIVPVAPALVRSYTGYYDVKGSLRSLEIKSNKLFMGEEELKFSSPETFFIHNLDGDAGIRYFKAIKDKFGKLIEILHDEDVHTPYIGPMASTLTPQTDTDTVRTKRIEKILGAFSRGESVTEGVTPGLNKDFAGFPIPELVGIKTISLIATQDVSGRGIVRHGGTVSQVLYYKCIAENATKYVLVYLTEGGQVTDEDVVTD
jgi:D-alanyl-D-alanine carboxypeptidase